jgi:dCTP deaminase
MGGEGNTLKLFPTQAPEASVYVPEYSKTGIISHQGLRAMIAAEEIGALGGIYADQIQPASLDLRLGRRAYRVRASFLPGPNSTVMERVKELDGLPAIDLTQGGAVLEKGAVYVVELLESVKLPSGIVGTANPKSSTGRVDVLTRLIADRATAFDRVDRGYAGPLFLEVAPLTFSVVVREGTRLNQIRFQRGMPPMPGTEIQRLYNEGQLVSVVGDKAPLRGNLVPVTVDLLTPPRGTIVGYKAKKNTNKLDLDQIKKYDPRDFWDKIERTNGRLNLDKDDFYILATREHVGVPPHLAAEMRPYDSGSGEFRVHYAGFFDPGFGWANGRAGGSRAVLEVRSYGVAFTLDHGQIVGWLDYSPIASGPTDRAYGTGMGSNYQGQGVALSKHFIPFGYPEAF